ncbi:MAG: hypothetical protein JWN83_2023 [Chitinophagaceae bacterium]|nr:hypothetical protein [Chitinophagaceae bacterium]
MRKILTGGLIFILSCNSENQKTITLIPPVKDSLDSKLYEPVDTSLQKKIADTLIKLSFIKESNRYIDSSTNHNHGIAFIMDALKNDSLIYVQAGLNREDRFVTGFQLYVNPTTMEIKVYEPASDKKLSVKEYEKHLKTLK